jgi:nitrogen-specific signal transduction histidine kinase
MEERQVLTKEDILQLVSMKELIGGFAHEVAQPLNAIMIASQVIQLRLDRSGLSDEEKSFLAKKLALVSSQVNRAAQIVDSFRTFSRGQRPGHLAPDLKTAFERVHGLMGQQFVGRGIQLAWEAQDPLPEVSVDPGVVEGVLIQGLACARDAVEALGKWHDRNEIEYSRDLRVRLLTMGQSSAVHLEWDTGKVPEGTRLTECERHPGLVTANALLAPSGGKIQVSRQAILIRFG